jgi:hypothetical protein
MEWDDIELTMCALQEEGRLTIAHKVERPEGDRAGGDITEIRSGAAKGDEVALKRRMSWCDGTDSVVTLDPNRFREATN